MKTIKTNGSRSVMIHLVFVIGEDLEYLVFLSGLILLPHVWIPGCAFTSPHLRASGVSLAPSCGVRGSFIFIAGLVLQRPSRERIPSPPCHSLSKTRGQHETSSQRSWLHEESRGRSEEDNGVIERRGGEHQRISTQHRIITDFLAGLHDG